MCPSSPVRFPSGKKVRSNATADEPRSKHRADQCAKSEIDKVDHSGSRIWCASYIGLWSHMVAAGIGHPEIEHTRKSSRKAPKAICCFASKLALPSNGVHGTKVLFADRRRLPKLWRAAVSTPAPHVSRTENKLLWRCSE